MNIKYAEKIKQCANTMLKAVKKRDKYSKDLLENGFEMTAKRRGTLNQNLIAECTEIDKCIDWIVCLTGYQNPDDLKDTINTSGWHEYPYIKEQVKRFMED